MSISIWGKSISILFIYGGKLALHLLVDDGHGFLNGFSKWVDIFWEEDDEEEVHREKNEVR